MPLIAAACSPFTVPLPSDSLGGFSTTNVLVLLHPRADYSIEQETDLDGRQERETFVSLIRCFLHDEAETTKGETCDPFVRRI
ncbi:uncharacterized protein V6R79_022663 [Siganus canaliculatus]